MSPTFFPTPSGFRAWLAENHATARELLVGYYKTASGRPSITWPESVAEALCFGWIDGIRQRVDDESYTIRFTPRRKGSTWSAVNIKIAEALIKSGQMQPAGLKAYEARAEIRSGIYSYEQRKPELEEPYGELLAQNESASAFFASQPGTYRKAVSWWIISAKREETRLKRLERLIAFSAEGRRLPELTSPARRA